MRFLFATIFTFLIIHSTISQEMNAEKLLEILQQESDTLKTSGNSYQFLIKDVMLICIFDENANRMRIVSPIVERKKIGEEEQEQVVDAIKQVYTAAITFGSSYSSTNLIFPGNTKRKEKTLPKILKKT